MKKKALKFMVMVALFITGSFARPAEPTTLPLAERMFILSKTYAAVNTYFSHWNSIPNFSLDSTFREFLKRAVDTENRFDFDLLMMEFISKLRNGHSWYYDRWLIKNFNQPLGFRFRYISGKWVVTESRVPGLERGDIIEKIDGQDFEDFYQSKKKYINASSDREARVKIQYRRFLFPRVFTLQVSGKGKVKIQRKAPPTPPAKKEASGKWLKEGVAYIKIPGFERPDLEKKALELVKKFSGARVLIVDVRGNSGGNTPSALVDALQDRPYRFWTEATFLSIALFRSYKEFLASYGNLIPKESRKPLEMLTGFFGNSYLMWTPSYQKPENTLFRGKLLILTDRGCASACEDFVVSFKDNGRALIVGERTAGSSGQPYIYMFNRDISVAIGAKREYMPDGTPFEGRGICPDEKVELTVEDIKSGKDPVLTRALKVAEER